jgi:hypothetical protein
VKIIHRTNAVTREMGWQRVKIARSVLLLPAVTTYRRCDGDGKKKAALAPIRYARNASVPTATVPGIPSIGNGSASIQPIATFSPDGCIFPVFKKMLYTG